MFGNGDRNFTNGDESNEIEMSEYQTIQPNRILCGLIKAMIIHGIKWTKYEMLSIYMKRGK